MLCSESQGRGALWLWSYHMLLFVCVRCSRHSLLSSHNELCRSRRVTGWDKNHVLNIGITQCDAAHSWLNSLPAIIMSQFVRLTISHKIECDNWKGKILWSQSCFRKVLNRFKNVVRFPKWNLNRNAASRRAFYWEDFIPRSLRLRDIVIDHWTKSGENQDPVKYVLNKLTGNFGHLVLTEDNLSPTLITIVQH